MGAFKTYLSNINEWVILDVFVMLLFAAAVFIFFKRRNNLVAAVLVGFYLLAYCAVCIANALSPLGILFITKWLLAVCGLIIIVFTAVAYQSNIKTFFSKLGKVGDKNKVFQIGTTEDDLLLAGGEIVKACQTLSKNDTGALIIIAPSGIPPHILQTGTPLNAEISCGLLESIFNTKAPLHDGAVIVRENLILAAGCFLPLSQEISLSKELGTRHRAAIGITEETNVLAIVVSEESGIISTARNGKLKRYMTPERLFEEIEEVFGITYTSQNRKGNKKETNK